MNEATQVPVIETTKGDINNNVVVNLEIVESINVSNKTQENDA